MSKSTHIVYTIGHSIHSIDKFNSLLQQQAISAVVDVRSTPFSRTNPHYNQGCVESTLRNCGIRYVFLGNELGARTRDPSCYSNGIVQYDLLARTALFQRGITRIRHEMLDSSIALMCAEKDPLTCHRSILIAKHLEDDNVEVRHILEDGNIETHTASILRLIRQLRLPENDLFRSRKEIIEDAYHLQSQRIAYRMDIQPSEHVSESAR